MSEKKVMIGGWLTESDRDNFKVLCTKSKVTMSAYFEAFVRAKLGDPSSLQRIDRVVKSAERKDNKK